MKECQNTPDAVLIDVREKDEFAGGHIPGAINLPLSSIAASPDKLPQKDTPVYVYCLSGARSRQAAGFLEKNGYTNVNNIGGISRYKGPVER